MIMTAMSEAPASAGAAHTTIRYSLDDLTVVTRDGAVTGRYFPHLPEIGYGQTRTYGQVAALVGNPKAVRAVGTACATNPLRLVVPCHRVLRADGTPGGYAGGAAAKVTLLSLEARGR
jgi:O-6-methylguanine DNA methyltransferase